MALKLLKDAECVLEEWMKMVGDAWGTGEWVNSVGEDWVEPTAAATLDHGKEKALDMAGRAARVADPPVTCNARSATTPAPLAFAVGARVVARGLVAAAALNGCAGTVVRVTAGDVGDRVGVDFGTPHGEKAVRPANLRLAADVSATAADAVPDGACGVCDARPESPVPLEPQPAAPLLGDEELTSGACGVPHQGSKLVGGPDVLRKLAALTTTPAPPAGADRQQPVDDDFPSHPRPPTTVVDSDRGADGTPLTSPAIAPAPRDNGRGAERDGPQG
eukprot:gene39921-4136_t